MKYLKTFIYILTIVGIIGFLYYKRSELQYILNIKYYNILLLLAIGIIPLTINALLFRNNISIFKLKLPFKEWYGLTVSNTMYNYLLPARGGLALRAMYLKQNYHFPYTQYLSFTAGTYILNLFNAALLACVLSIAFWLSGKLENILFLYISIFLLLGIVGVLILLYKFNPEQITEKNKVCRTIKNAAIGLKQFKKYPGKVRNLIIIQLGFILAISLRLYVSYHVLEIHTFYPKLILINALVAFSMVFSFTPGNIGIKEGIIGLSSNLLGISYDQALVGAILDRIIALLIVFSLGLFFSHKLLFRTKL